jgi:hypothetical protein
VDIDLMENCLYTGDQKKIVNRIVRSFQAMAVRLQKEKFTYLGDFKAGEDERYYCPFLEPYDKFLLREWIRTLHSMGLLTLQEKCQWLKLVNKKDDLKEIIRKKQIIRWSLKEIRMGKKKLIGGIIRTLRDAIQSRTVIKIDLWSWIDHRFVEVTNWFCLRFRETSNNPWEDLTQPLGVYEESILQDIFDYFDPNVGKNMKLAKRLWLYAGMTHDTVLLRLLYPLFRSDAAQIGQIQGEITILLNLLQLPKPPLNLIFDRIVIINESIGTFASNIIPLKDKQQIFRRTSVLFQQPKDSEMMLACLKYIDKKLIKYTQQYVYAILKKKKIFTHLEKLFYLKSPLLSPNKILFTT